MDRPIGIIDSGVGGLTVAYEIMRQLPRENFIYLGDTLRCPYGSRSEEEVKNYTLEMVSFVLEKRIKMLVIACNTATAYTLELLQKKLNIPVIGVIQPGARTAIKTTKNNKVAIIGTEGTIRSQSYEDALKLIHPETEVISLACPLFVPLIEKGVYNGHKIINVVKQSLSPIKQTECDTLILGCTHYPLIQSTIQNELGISVKVISSGEETAREVSTLLEFYGINNKSNRESKYSFFTTGDSDIFADIANRLFKMQVKDIKTADINVVTI